MRRGFVYRQGAKPEFDAARQAKNLMLLSSPCLARTVTPSTPLTPLFTHSREIG